MAKQVMSKIRQSQPDTLFASPLDQTTDFRFDEAVARVFPDMIKRSVPGYTTIIPMIGLITQRYAQDNSVCYDLGCSLGASTLAMRHGLENTKARIVGVDNSESMIERCQHYIELDNDQAPVELVCDDIRAIDFEPCSVVTLNFTLQFLPIEDRLPLLQRIYDALLPGGVLILSEKLHFDQTMQQSEQQELHWLFKRANGYSDLELSQKRNAIENVLITDTKETHLSRFHSCGFNASFSWYQCFNFSSFLAIK
jgi:tRNA (cmo5U34)-methyltransferase